MMMRQTKFTRDQLIAVAEACGGVVHEDKKSVSLPNRMHWPDGSGDFGCRKCGYCVCNCTDKRTVAEILAPPPEPKHDQATCGVCKTKVPLGVSGMPALEMEHVHRWDEDDFCECGATRMDAYMELYGAPDVRVVEREPMTAKEAARELGMLERKYGVTFVAGTCDAVEDVPMIELQAFNNWIRHLRSTEW